MLLILRHIIRGYDYYFTPLAERPRHPGYTNLKSGSLAPIQNAINRGAAVLQRIVAKGLVGATDPTTKQYLRVGH